MLNLLARKFHFRKYKNFLGGGFFYTFELGLKSASGSCILYHLCDLQKQSPLGWHYEKKLFQLKKQVFTKLVFILSQPANFGPMDVPKMSSFNVPRTSPKDPIWPAQGRLKLRSRSDVLGRPEMTPRGRPNLTSKGRTLDDLENNP